MTSEFGIAVHALVYLNHKAKTLSSEELAENICTNPARVRKVMAKLKKAGLVATKEGLTGGYSMERNPGDVSLAEISAAVEARFVSSAWRSGDSDMECLVASGMADIMDGIYLELDGLCKQHLKGVTVLDIDRKIFGNGSEKGELI